MDEGFHSVYPYSCEEAKRLDQLTQWRESRKENIACKNAIENAIRQNFDGMHLDAGCAERVITEYGFKRVNWVLANTVQQKEEDGRFSHYNKDWAKSTYIPPDEDNFTGYSRNLDFVADSHPAVLDGFINQYRRAYQSLGLFEEIHCEPHSEDMCYDNRVLVLSPDSLRESSWNQKNQLWLAIGGFGCSPTSIGRAVFAACLSDGREARWNRLDFIGIMKEAYLPDWAKEKLTELQKQSTCDSPDLGDMKMI